MIETLGRGYDEIAAARQQVVRTLVRMSVAEHDGRASNSLVLVEPVRQRLVQLASEVLGRMPAEDVPTSLRAIAKFTPAKRTRLGASALAAALDADEQFRERVAEIVAASTPQLVEAIRSLEATPASDPIDTAVVAYLIRPDGWTDLIANVSATWSNARAGRDATEGRNAQLRAELADLRVRLRLEIARADDAVAAASAGSAEEATRLRNTLRIRTGELRAAERLLDQVRTEAAHARAEVDVLRGAQADAERAHATELERLRNRIAELDRTVESAKRETRTEREVDDGRLRLLVDTLGDAAAGIRRELALPPGGLRPADAVASAGGGERSGAAHDPVALERLLQLPQVHLIVDGYNVTMTGYPGLPLVDQRTRLISAMAALQARVGAEVTVVFDGGARPPAQPRAPRGVRVLFSAPHELADDLIRRLVAAEPEGRALVVVTTDQQIVTDVRRAGAWTVPSAVLVDRLA